LRFFSAFIEFENYGIMLGNTSAELSWYISKTWQNTSAIDQVGASVIVYLLLLNFSQICQKKIARGCGRTPSCYATGN